MLLIENTDISSPTQPSVLKQTQDSFLRKILVLITGTLRLIHKPIWALTWVQFLGTFFLPLTSEGSWSWLSRHVAVSYIVTPPPRYWMDITHDFELSANQFFPEAKLCKIMFMKV
jgi:hypothetical protein